MQRSHDEPSRLIARIALGLLAVTLTMELVRWLVWRSLEWTSIAMLFGIATIVAPQATGLDRARPRLTNAIVVVGLAITLPLTVMLFRDVLPELLRVGR